MRMAGSADPGAGVMEFVLGRLGRLLPVLVVAVGLAWAVDPAVRVADLPWHLLFATNLMSVAQGEWPGACSHLWSVSVQMQFYVLAPLGLLALPERWRVRGLGLVIVASLAFRAGGLALGWNPWLRWVSLPACADAFAVGAWLAHGAAARAMAPRWGAWRTVGVAVVGLAALRLAVHLRTNAGAPGWLMLVEPLECLFLAALLCVVARGRWAVLRRGLGWRPLAAGGAVTYSLYAFHPVVGAALARWFPELGAAHPVRHALLAVGGSLGCAWVAWRCLERRDLARRVTGWFRSGVEACRAEWLPRGAMAGVLAAQILVLALFRSWENPATTPAVDAGLGWGSVVAWAEADPEPADEWRVPAEAETMHSWWEGAEEGFAG